MQGPNPHWLQENWIAIMEPKGDLVLAETFLAVEAATSDTTTSAAFPTLVAPIIMCMFQNSSDIGMMNPLISEAKLDTCFLTTPEFDKVDNLLFYILGFDTKGFHKTG